MRTNRQSSTRLRTCVAGLACLLAAACAQPLPRTTAPADGDGTVAVHPDAVAHALDPVHTRIVIAVDHAGFSSAIGTLSGTVGTLHLVPGQWEGARVEARIPLSRLDFGDADWNRAVAGRGLLDSTRHPEAVFRSGRIEPLDAGRARIHGELTLRGHTRGVVLHAVRNAEKRHPLPPFRQTVGFSATATLSRAEFGSSAWDSMIGDAVQVRLEVEAVRAR